MMSPYVLDKLQAAHDRNDTFLDLGNCGLNKVPGEIEKLSPHLRQLNLGRAYWEDGLLKGPAIHLATNDITGHGLEAITKLVNLTTLHINYNRISGKGSAAISTLKNLTGLFVSKNELTDQDALEFSTLENLEALHLHSNRISDKGAEYIARLTKLKSLDLAFNELTDKGAEAISKLTPLKWLDIRDNEITIKGLEVLVNKLVNLTSLNFDQYREIPSEVRSDIKALRSFFASKRKVSNTLVKMILIGNTTAGKSSLADYLVNNKYVADRQTTHGLKHWRWTSNAGDTVLQTNIWDLGGQDYYHATHDLFLNDKTLFLFLHTNRTIQAMTAEQDQWFPEIYWLANIRSATSENSLVWYVQTKADLAQAEYLDKDTAKRFRVCSPQYHISVKNAFEKEKVALRNMETFIDDLKEQLCALAFGELPISWVKIRDIHLPRWRKTHLFLSREEFKEKSKIALKNNLPDFEDLIGSWDGLLLYLKGCGEVIYFEGYQSLDNMIFLSAETLMKGIYELILKKEILENKGFFSISQLHTNHKQKAALYLQVLLAYNLIFKRPGSEDVYIAPQYLPENQHIDLIADHMELAFVIRFPDYMSRSLITSFLVEYAPLCENENRYWRYGVYFRKNNTTILAKIDADKQLIFLYTDNEETRNKFNILKELFVFFTSDPRGESRNKVYSEGRRTSTGDSGEIYSEKINRISPDIELSLDSRQFAKIRDIKLAMQHGLAKAKSTDDSFIELNELVQNLLGTKKNTPKKIFLSYSHTDERYIKEFERHLAALKRTGKIETWYDNSIAAGEDWDSAIKNALRNTDIVLLMLSPDFMASDYIWNTEIPQAIKNEVVIIPVFLRACDFRDTVFDLYKLQGLPRNMEWIVNNSSRYRDQAYLEIVESIKKLL